MSENEADTPASHGDDDDDDFSDLPDDKYPSRLGMEWTPAVVKVVEQAKKRLKERERENKSDDDASEEK